MPSRLLLKNCSLATPVPCRSTLAIASLQPSSQILLLIFPPPKPHLSKLHLGAGPLISYPLHALFVLLCANLYINIYDNLPTDDPSPHQHPPPQRPPFITTGMIKFSLICGFRTDASFSFVGFAGASPASVGLHLAKRARFFLPHASRGQPSSPPRATAKTLSRVPNWLPTQRRAPPQSHKHSRHRSGCIFRPVTQHRLNLRPNSLLPPPRAILPRCLQCLN